ncbi:LSU ribosomal protein L25P [Rhodococcus sp. OK519]|uniref:50S ribosomal protein L25/general stress protein Ctc n=1 Tax=Rhodococcus sp. OK519 TaxID=2135729 RepID=UPI000D36F5D2|nr:LSU ribosomal protein L25P [Rhodococcus sp. OK519]
MSDDNRLVASTRSEFGKGAARRARRDGQVPAVLYGHGTDPQHLNLPARDFASILRAHGTNVVINLDIDGKDQLALTKSIVVHPIRRHIEHADLLIVKKGEKVSVEVRIVVTGNAAPGALVTEETNTIKLEVDALDIPESVEVSVEGAEVGTQFLAGAVALPKGATLADDAELLLVNVVAAQAAEPAAGEETEAAAGAEA